MTEYIQVVTTTEKQEDAEKLARAVLEQRVAACVQILGPMTSTYWWKGVIESTTEWLCVIKSTQRVYPMLEKAIKAAHPYEVPEILAMPVVDGNPAYFDWLKDSVETKGG